MSTSTDWDVVERVVADGRDELATLTTARDLYQWAKDHDVDGKMRFGKFKTILKKHTGQNFDEIREEGRKQRAAALAAAAADAPSVSLLAAGAVAPEGEAGAYAICTADGDTVWRGDFYDDDRHFDGTETSAHVSAAHKAVWLAGKARAEKDLEALRLIVTVSDHHVSAAELAAEGARYRVVVELVVCDTATAADESVDEPGFVSWRGTNLAGLING